MKIAEPKKQLRPSIPNPAAPGEFIFLAPLPALQILCPACGGYVKYVNFWQCTECRWADTPAGDGRGAAGEGGEESEEAERRKVRKHGIMIKLRM